MRIVGRLAMGAGLLALGAALLLLWVGAPTTNGGPDAASHHQSIAGDLGLDDPSQTGLPAPTPGPDDPSSSLPLTPPAPVGGSAADQEQTSLAAAANAPTGTDQERDLSTLDRRTPIPPEAVVREPGAAGGCHEAYGAPGQCLPRVPPSLADHARAMADAGLDPSTMQHPWTCTELTQLFPDGITVRVAGVDPLSLDASGDALACGAGD